MAKQRGGFPGGGMNMQGMMAQARGCSRTLPSRVQEELWEARSMRPLRAAEP